MGNTIQNKGRFPVLALAGYFKAERLVGEACEDLRGREGANGLFFTHSDHLGSSSWTTDADGRAVQHIEYLPFGEELLNQRATSYSERYTFTGKELDEESNLYYYDARYNSSTYAQLHNDRCASANEQALCSRLSGHFTTVDPMSDKCPAVNPYLYCAGNPIKYIDPTGEVIAIEDGDKTYTFGEIDGKYGFYCDGQLLQTSFAKDVTNALCTIRNNGPSGKLLVDANMENEHIVRIVESNKDNGYDAKSNTVYWNPNKNEGGLDENENNTRPAYIGLAHEMAHNLSKWYGYAYRDKYWFTSAHEEISKDEIFACCWENIIRCEGKIPLRVSYSYAQYPDHYVPLGKIVGATSIKKELWEATCTIMTIRFLHFMNKKNTRERI